MTHNFLSPEANTDIEEGMSFTPKFDDKGLIGAIVQDAETGQIVMFAYMNAEALLASLTTGFAHYYSRSRGKQWMKGETSGHRQKIVEILADCDQDALVVRVETEGTGANCHTGRKSCFYRAVTLDGLKETDNKRLFDPKTVYSSGS